MSRFKFGETVIEKKTGDEYVVDGFNCCAGCGLPCIYLKGFNEIGNVECNMDNTPKGCGHIHYNVRRMLAEALFEKPISLAETTEYKLKVSIPELIELKELQNQ